MTVLMLVHQNPYTLVAADRRVVASVAGVVVSRGENETVQDVQTGKIFTRPKVKVAAHPDPRIPLVYAWAGIASLKFEGEQRPVEDLIAYAFRNSHTSISAKPLEFLTRLVGEQKGRDLTILIGTSQGALQVHFADGRASETGGIKAWIEPSAHTLEFFQSLREDEKLPPPGSAPSKIAKHMRRLLGHAVEYASKQFGDEADVGGPIDVALASPGGTNESPQRLVHRTGDAAK